VLDNSPVKSVHLSGCETMPNNKKKASTKKKAARRGCAGNGADARSNLRFPVGRTVLVCLGDPGASTEAWQPATIVQQNFSELCDDLYAVRHLYAYRIRLLRGEHPDFNIHIDHDHDVYVRDLDPRSVVITGTNTKDGQLDQLPGIPTKFSPELGVELLQLAARHGMVRNVPWVEKKSGVDARTIGVSLIVQIIMRLPEEDLDRQHDVFIQTIVGNGRQRPQLPIAECLDSVSGYTLLHWAAVNGGSEFAERLMLHEDGLVSYNIMLGPLHKLGDGSGLSDSIARCKDRGRTAFQLAVAHGQADFVDTFVALLSVELYGSYRPSYPSDQGDSCRCHGGMYRATELVARDANGCNVLDIALSQPQSARFRERILTAVQGLYELQIRMRLESEGADLTYQQHPQTDPTIMGLLPGVRASAGATPAALFRQVQCGNTALVSWIIANNKAIDLRSVQDQRGVGIVHAAYTSEVLRKGQYFDVVRHDQQEEAEQNKQLYDKSVHHASENFISDPENKDIASAWVQAVQDASEWAAAHRSGGDDDDAPRQYGFKQYSGAPSDFQTLMKHSSTGGADRIELLQWLWSQGMPPPTTEFVAQSADFPVARWLFSRLAAVRLLLTKTSICKCAPVVWEFLFGEPFQFPEHAFRHAVGISKSALPNRERACSQFNVMITLPVDATEPGRLLLLQWLVATFSVCPETLQEPVESVWSTGSNVLHTALRARQPLLVLYLQEFFPKLLQQQEPMSGRYPLHLALEQSTNRWYYLANRMFASSQELVGDESEVFSWCDLRGQSVRDCAIAGNSDELRHLAYRPEREAAMIQLTALVHGGASMREVMAHVPQHIAELASMAQSFLEHGICLLFSRPDVAHVLEFVEAVLAHGRLDILMWCSSGPGNAGAQADNYALKTIRKNLTGNPSEHGCGAEQDDCGAEQGYCDYYAQEFEDNELIAGSRVFSRHRGIRAGLTGRQLASLCGHASIVSWIDNIEERQFQEREREFISQCCKMEEDFCRGVLWGASVQELKAMRGIAAAFLAEHREDKTQLDEKAPIWYIDDANVFSNRWFDRPRNRASFYDENLGHDIPDIPKMLRERASGCLRFVGLLQAAACLGHTHLVRWYFEGCESDAELPSSDAAICALVAAVQHHKHEVFDLCLDQGVDVHACVSTKFDGSVTVSEDGDSLLKVAANNLNFRAASRLFEANSSTSTLELAKSVCSFKYVKFHETEGIARAQLVQDGLGILGMLFRASPWSPSGCAELLRVFHFGSQRHNTTTLGITDEFSEPEVVRWLFSIGAYLQQKEQSRIKRFVEESKKQPASDEGTTQLCEFLATKLDEYDRICALASLITSSGDVGTFERLVVTSGVANIAVLRDGDGRTLLQLATLHKRHEIVEFLVVSHHVPLEVDGQPLAEFAARVDAQGVAEIVPRLRVLQRQRPGDRQAMAATKLASWWRKLVVCDMFDVLRVHDVWADVLEHCRSFQVAPDRMPIASGKTWMDIKVWLAGDSGVVVQRDLELQLDSTLPRAAAAAVEAAGCEADSRHADYNAGGSGAQGEQAAISGASDPAVPATRPRTAMRQHAGLAGAGLGSDTGTQQPCSILLTSAALRWQRKVGDQKRLDLFTRRLAQLATGDRSYCLAKHLKAAGASAPTIVETKLDRGQRILWTQRGSSVLVWYVAKHDNVQRCLSLIRLSYDRLASPAGVPASVLATLTANTAACEPEVLVDPTGNTPLKMHAVHYEELPKLALGAAWTPPLMLTARETEIVERDGAVLLLGRSGTGKTLCVCNRMSRDRQVYDGASLGNGHLKQLFLARTQRLCDYVCALQHSAEEAHALDHTQFETLDSFVAHVGGSLRQPGTLATARNDWQIAQRVDFVRFARDVWPQIRGSASLDALVAWGQIRSFIKGGLRTVVSAAPMQHGEYTSEAALPTSRCCLGPKARADAYDVFVRYTEFLERANLWDDADRVMQLVYVLRSRQQRGEARRMFDKIYVDEVQDATQAEIGLLVLALGGHSHDLFLAGDGAQAVTYGAYFRFEEVRSAVHILSSGAQKVPRAEVLHRNYRSHSGVLSVANAVLDQLHRHFAKAADKVTPDYGLVRGPRPDAIRADSWASVKAMAIGNTRVIVRDELCSEAREQLGGALVYGIREAKGLEFGNVLLVNFFGALSLGHEKHAWWKRIWRDPGAVGGGGSAGAAAGGKPSPEMEVELKLFYTAITRSCHRLVFVELADTPSATAWYRYLERGRLGNVRARSCEQLPGWQDAASMTADDWRNEGIELASLAPEAGDVGREVELLKKAVGCFLRCSEPWLHSRAEAQLRAARAKQQGEDPAEQARSLVGAGMFREAARVCRDVHGDGRNLALDARAGAGAATATATASARTVRTFERIWPRLERIARRRWEALNTHPS
jgi:hypothetical protein